MTKDRCLSEKSSAVKTPDALQQSASVIGSAAADRLNHDCFCITLDRLALLETLDAGADFPGFAADLARTHPSLFSNVPVFVSRDMMAIMESVVAAAEAAAKLDGFVAAAMTWAPATARVDFGPIGALMGYDFHITEDGPRLIEINTNAGGAFLNAALARAQRACCLQVQPLVDQIAPQQNFADQVVAMFIAEWQLHRGVGRPSTIAIVDDDPDAQFLLPEFKLAQAILEAAGIRTVIADPGKFRFDGATLTLDGLAIDLIYNRLVDFALTEDRHAALASAYNSGAVVVSPNPHNHALLANKRNLSLLSNPACLKSWGLSAPHRAALQRAIPETVIVSPANAESSWANRRNLFFKPAGGYGSKAAYRGEKLTRKVWAEVQSADYVAQCYAPPSKRIVMHNDSPTEFKTDIRLYTYAGSTVLAAARLYQGQTTNMRTPGGGFAPVLKIYSPK